MSRVAQQAKSLTAKLASQIFAAKDTSGYKKLPKKLQGAVAPYLNRVRDGGYKFVPLDKLDGRRDMGKGLLNTRSSRELNDGGWAIVKP